MIQTETKNSSFIKQIDFAKERNSNIKFNTNYENQNMPQQKFSNYNKQNARYSYEDKRTYLNYEKNHYKFNSFKNNFFENSDSQNKLNKNNIDCQNMNDIFPFENNNLKRLNKIQNYKNGQYFESINKAKEYKFSDDLNKNININNTENLKQNEFFNIQVPFQSKHNSYNQNYNHEFVENNNGKNHLNNSIHNPLSKIRKMDINEVKEFIPKQYVIYNKEPKIIEKKY